MFVTAPLCEWVPSWRTPSSRELWTVAVLTDSKPWYVVTFMTRDDHGEQEHLRTVLVVWEAELVTVIDSLPRCDVISLQRVHVQNERGFWSMDEVTEVYVSDTNADEYSMQVLLKIEGSDRLFVSRGGKFESAGSVRRLYSRDEARADSCAKVQSLPPNECTTPAESKAHDVDGSLRPLNRDEFLSCFQVPGKHKRGVGDRHESS